MSRLAITAMLALGIGVAAPVAGHAAAVPTPAGVKAAVDVDRYGAVRPVRRQEAGRSRWTRPRRARTRPRRRTRPRVASADPARAQDASSDARRRSRADPVGRTGSRVRTASRRGRTRPRGRRLALRLRLSAVVPAAAFRHDRRRRRARHDPHGGSSRRRACGRTGTGPVLVLGRRVPEPGLLGLLLSTHS